MTTTTSSVLNAKAPAATPAPIAARPPRYARVTRAVNVRLTEDDQCIMREVYMHRFLRSTHIAKLLPSKGSKNLQHRLRLLYDAGYLDRIREDAPQARTRPWCMPSATAALKFSAFGGRVSTGRIKIECAALAS